MEEDIDEYVQNDLEDFIIKDKAYERNMFIKKLKIIIIIFLAFVISLTIVGTALFIHFKYKDNTFGEIRCVYKTK